MTDPSPADPPKGWEVRARRRREHNDEHFPRMLALWRRGLIFREIAGELNKDSLNSDGHSWTSVIVQRVLRDRLDRAEYDALAKVGMARGKAAQMKPLDAALPRVVELLEAGLSQVQVAERLQADGYTNSAGSPWRQQHISDLLRRRLPPAKLAELMPGGKARGLSAAARAAKEFEEAIVPRIVELRRSGLSLARSADRLNREGVKNGQGRAWNAKHLADILKRHLDPAEYAALAARGKLPVVLGAPGTPALVLGVDGRHREKSLSKKQRDVVEALLHADPERLSNDQLRKVTGWGGARGIANSLREDPDWAAVIYPPDAGGWRIGPPRPINGSSGDT